MTVPPMASLATSLLTDSIFLRRLICYLMPYFTPVTKSLDRAEADILETLASYCPRTRPELLNVVQIIAYSMSGLELLILAKIDTSLSGSQQIRLRGCANNLNRSAHQAEKTLTARLKCDLPVQSGIAAKPVRAEPIPAPLMEDTDPVQTEEILRRIDAQVAAARTAAQPAKSQKGSAMLNALFAELAPSPKPVAP